MRQKALQLALALALSMVLVSVAEATTRRHVVPVQRPHYVAMPLGSALAVGPYTLLSPADNPTGGQLVNEVTGQRSTVPAAPRCSQEVQLLAGGSNLVVGCLNTAEVFHLPTGPWQTVPLAQECIWQNEGAEMSACTVTGIGSQWMQLSFTCYNCASFLQYQSLKDGTLFGEDPQSRTSAPNLDTPALTRRLCRPLTVNPAATVTFDNHFVVQTTPNDVDVERCGTRRPVATARPAGLAEVRPSLVLWSQGGDKIRGVCLANGRQIRIAPPPGAVVVTEITVSQHHMFIGDVTDSETKRLWRASWPSCR